MKESTVDEMSLEPERYELYAEVNDHFEQASREFFEHVGGGGIVVVFTLDQVSGLHEAGGRRGGPGVSLPQEIGAWLHIGEDGQVKAYTGKVEVGQNIRTSLAQIITDELPVPLESIEIVLGDTDLSPFDFGTVGSRTTPVTAPQVRKVAAAARQMLRDLAIQKSGGEPGTGREFGVAELARGQKLFKAVGEEFEAKSANEWQIGDAPVAKANGRALITGQHRYPSDLKRPGMAYGKVLRAPAMNSRRVSLDASALTTMPEITLVQDGEFVGVVAPDELSASRALELIQVQWQVAEGQLSTDQIFDNFKQRQGEVRGYAGPSCHVAGEIDAGFAAAHQVLESSYTLPYIAHAPLEPRAAVAEWSQDVDSKLTVWTGTQRPFGVRAELAEAFGISENRIRVIVPDTGSGYGGKHTGDAAIEAARLARVAGKPVKLVWTREEEFTWAYFRPAGIIEIRSGVDARGMLSAWEHHNTNSGASGMRTLYRVPNQHIEFHAAQSPLRQGSYRALAATANHFARETHMDELAHAVAREPLAFRLQNLDDARLRDVLEAATAHFGWNGAKPAPYHGFGLAGGHEKGSYVANCVEVAVEPSNGAVKVVRVVTAFECGTIMVRDNVQQQVEGAVIMGLGGAMFEAMHFADGVILNPCFSKYRVPRFGDIPVLETVLLDRKDLPSVGAGETPIVAIAPAIGNAIFDAVGVRLRSLPFAPGGTNPSLKGVTPRVKGV